jgi:hypothetical protein
MRVKARRTFPMSYGDFRRVLYKNPADRKPPPAPSRLRSLALLLLLVTLVLGIAWIGISPFLR